MEASTKIEGGSPSAVESAGTAGTVSVSGLREYCPECYSRDIRFGSRDPCEGDYYWCHSCGYGPILFPLDYRRKFCAPVIGAEQGNKARALVAHLRGHGI